MYPAQVGYLNTKSLHLLIETLHTYFKFWNKIIKSVVCPLANSLLLTQSLTLGRKGLKLHQQVIVTESAHWLSWLPITPKLTFHLYTIDKLHLTLMDFTFILQSRVGCKNKQATTCGLTTLSAMCHIIHVLYLGKLLSSSLHNMYTDLGTRAAYKNVLYNAELISFLKS